MTCVCRLGASLSNSPQGLDSCLVDAVTCPCRNDVVGRVMPSVQHSVVFVTASGVESAAANASKYFLLIHILS